MIVSFIHGSIDEQSVWTIKICMAFDGLASSPRL